MEKSAKHQVTRCWTRNPQVYRTNLENNIESIKQGKTIPIQTAGHSDITEQ